MADVNAENTGIIFSRCWRKITTGLFLYIQWNYLSKNRWQNKRYFQIEELECVLPKDPPKDISKGETSGRREICSLFLLYHKENGEHIGEWGGKQQYKRTTVSNLRGEKNKRETKSQTTIYKGTVGLQILCHFIQVNSKGAN